MESIALPSKIEVVESNRNRAQFVIEPCYPGYGTTLGNALRRVLLSSLPGAAVVAVKIDGVDHEFSTLPYVKEDVVSMILNLKQLRFKLHGDEGATLSLKVRGERVATGADIEGPSTVEVATVKQTIATLTDKAASLNMEIMVRPGRGYVPVENREKEKVDIGWIAIDAVYTPVKTVNFNIENVRVGQITNYDRLVLEVETDGTISPEHAVTQASKILVDHFSRFTMFEPKTIETPKKKRSRSKKETTQTTSLPQDQPQQPNQEVAQHETS